MVMILGESGSGKSTSLKNLPSEETFVIQVTPKMLPFKGANKKYGARILNQILPEFYSDLMGMQRGGIFGGGTTNYNTTTNSDSFNMYGPVNLQGVQDVNMFMRQLGTRSRASKRY